MDVVLVVLGVLGLGAAVFLAWKFPQVRRPLLVVAGLIAVLLGAKGFSAALADRAETARKAADARKALRAGRREDSGKEVEVQIGALVEQENELHATASTEQEKIEGGGRQRLGS